MPETKARRFSPGMAAIIVDRRRIGYAGNLVSRILTAALLSLPLVGCHRIQAPASVVRMADPAAVNQLIEGFYAVEGFGDHAFRWVGPDATLALAPPHAARNGARLLVRLYFPETQIQKLGPITLTAFVDGQPLASETYAEAGGYDFVRDVPECFLDTNVLPVGLSFFPYSPKSDTDGRALGAVVVMAALEPK
jgi:hypothetical protein